MVESQPYRSPWPHAWAIVTVLATLPLLFLGAEVTTKQVGMADPVWPTVPWYLFGITWVDQGIGFLIEHGHRLAGYTVGTCAILLVLALWRWEERAWVRWLGVIALLGIITQGVLGGFRVRLNVLMGPDLALVHGCFGQMVFATLVSLAIVTSRRWQVAVPEQSGDGSGDASLRRWTLMVVGLIVCQLILGAILRHKGSPIGQRGHLLMAFGVTFAIAWLARLVWAQHAGDRNLSFAVTVMVGLLGLQLMLGIEAWMVRFMSTTAFEPGHWLLNRDLVRSLHVLVGSCLLANAVVAALEAHRGLASVPAAVPGPAALRLEEAV